MRRQRPRRNESSSRDREYRPSARTTMDGPGRCAHYYGSAVGTAGAAPYQRVNAPSVTSASLVPIFGSDGRRTMAGSCCRAASRPRARRPCGLGRLATGDSKALDGVPDRTVISGESRSLTNTPRGRSLATDQFRPLAPGVVASKRSRCPWPGALRIRRPPGGPMLAQFETRQGEALTRREQYR